MNPPLLLRLARLYGWHAPVERGKRFVAGVALRLCAERETALVVPAKHGGRFHVRVGDPMYHDLYFQGTYEPAVTECVRRIIRKGDTVYDVGANFGWYSVFFASLVGVDGSVHSFEPVPWIFDELRANLALNRLQARVIANRVALGNQRARTTVHTFDGLPHGHSSLSSLKRNDFSTFPCDMITLDQYIANNGSSIPRLIKCDVEGAELHVLNGATRLLKSIQRPMWILEMNENTSGAFGYRPNELLRTLAVWGYEFYRITTRGLRSLDGSRVTHGDNVLCITRGSHEVSVGSSGVQGYEARSG